MYGFIVININFDYVNKREISLTLCMILPCRVENSYNQKPDPDFQLVFC
jgi:hypothetical protein